MYYVRLQDELIKSWLHGPQNLLVFLQIMITLWDFFKFADITGSQRVYVIDVLAENVDRYVLFLILLTEGDLENAFKDPGPD
jgi:hypothetical protein